MHMNKIFSTRLTLLGLGCVIGQLLSVSTATAAISLDRTRAIYSGDDKSISLNIVNTNNTYPFLAQAWIENDQNQKVNSPLMVLPPLQRLEPGAKGIVRVTKMAGVEKLPQDRETVFYFNLREIPPKSEKSNVMQLALQTQIKLFYRPASIKPKDGDVWQEKLVFTKQGNDLKVENPTPFYVTLTGLTERSQKKGRGNTIGNFQSTMLAPQGNHTFRLQQPNLNTFVMTYINDHGGHPELHFSCQGGNRCVAQPAIKE